MSTKLLKSTIRNSKNFFINLIIILSIFTLDRLTKLYVIYLDKINNGSEILVSKFLNIYLIWNQGIAFGLLSFEKDNLYNILTALIIIIILVLFVLITRSTGLKKYSVFFGENDNLWKFYKFKYDLQGAS